MAKIITSHTHFLLTLDRSTYESENIQDLEKLLFEFMAQENYPRAKEKIVYEWYDLNELQVQQVNPEENDIEQSYQLDEKGITNVRIAYVHFYDEDELIGISQVVRDTPVIIGQRYELVNDLDNYPFYATPKGSKGTVKAVDISETEQFVWLEMDEHYEGLEEWDNQIQFFSIGTFLANAKLIEG